MKSRTSLLKRDKAWNKPKKLIKHGWNVPLNKSWQNGVMIKDPDSSIWCRVCKSSKSLKWEYGSNKDAPSYGTWVIHDSLFAKAIKSKSRAKAKEEQAMWSMSSTSKCCPQAPFNSNNQESSIIPSHMKTRKPSQGRDKTLILSHTKTSKPSQRRDKTPRGPFED